MKITSFFAALPLAFISVHDLSHLNSSTVTVSGLSSGALMAGQMLVAASAKIQGAGLIAGAPFSCSGGDLSRAFQCIEQPETIDVSSLIQATRQLERSHKIDPLQNLKSRRLFILNGTQDTVVRPLAGRKSAEYFAAFMLAGNIVTEFALPSGHGFPTLDRGNSCTTEGAPWINSCNYDGAQNILENLLGKKLIPGKAQKQNLYQLSVAGLVAPDSNINNAALIYVPQNCLRESCDLHVVFHGCRQTLDEAGWDFISQAGYNDWAEANNLVILYPNVLKTLFNPKGCWDWWGYTNSDFNNKKAPQIQSVLKIISKITGGSK